MLREDYRRPEELLERLLLDQASVMRQDFTLGEVQRHLQGHEDGELERDQLPATDAETLLQLLQKQSQKHSNDL